MDIETQLAEVLHYESKTGLLFWTDKAHKSVKNKQAGTPNHLGYIIIFFKNKPYKAHRIAWLLTHGSWPSQMIDHIDGNTSNNALSNLRDVDNKTNQCNRHLARIDSKSGLMGASPFRNKWRAQITRNGIIKYIGLYDTAIEAHEAYKKQKNGFAEEKNL
jgi:hypothetical protein